MSIIPQRQQFDVPTYHQMGELDILPADIRTELIKGDIINRSPIKSEHAWVVDFIVESFVLQLQRRAIVRGQNPIQLGDYSEPEPDIVVVQPRADRYRSGHPTASAILFLIEVADASLSYDREVKAPLYAQANIPMYAIANLPEQQLELYQSPVDGEYQLLNTYQVGDSSPNLPLGLQLDLKELFG